MFTGGIKMIVGKEEKIKLMCYAGFKSLSGLFSGFFSEENVIPNAMIVVLID
jgi:hypothetical protein